jgi:hypothetical protein
LRIEATTCDGRSNRVWHGIVTRSCGRLE